MSSRLMKIYAAILAAARHYIKRIADGSLRGDERREHHRKDQDDREYQKHDLQDPARFRWFVV